MPLKRACLYLAEALMVVSSLTAAAVVTYHSEQTRTKLPTLALTLIRDSDGLCAVVSLTTTQQHRLLRGYDDIVTESKILEVHPAQVPNVSNSEQLQFIGFVAQNLWTKAQEHCLDLTVRVAPVEVSTNRHHQHAFSATDAFETRPLLELHPLVVSGSSRNRVDLTFFSDGYAIHEKKKFLSDAKKLALDMSQNETFSTVQPLLNFWAAFSPSKESGIGIGGVPKDTVFGLYRDGTELRAVYCSKKDVARNACLSLKNRCDYAILLGNDPLYGGLGGEFTISTASELNGALVLRHELGHSIIGVGEEYDGGFAYFGVNAVQNISKSSNFKWSHWLSSPLSPMEVPRQERAIMPFQAYPWILLNKTSSWSGAFFSSGLYSRHIVRFSVSGLPGSEDLTVYLDGEVLGWKPRLDIRLDRWHYDIHRTQALAGGLHNLTFSLGESAQEGKAQLCSTEIIEYGDESEFNSTVGYYGAFPTFSDGNITTFRPTNEQCLMRIVTSSSFCSVCLEGLWLSLLKRVDLIDRMFLANTSTDSVELRLALVPFGHLRSPSTYDLSESYSIKWEKDGVHLPQFTNSTRIIVDKVNSTWRAFVRLHTAEVKEDPHGLLESQRAIELIMDTGYPNVIFWSERD